jgi:hypothetical protein
LHGHREVNCNLAKGKNGVKMPKYTKITLPIWLLGLVAFSVGVAIFSFVLYVLEFGPNLSDRQEVWGQFGDFIGGTLNPLFALTALLALLYTIVLQSTELKNSTEQLSKSAKALDSQNSVLKKQSFEATFFQLINLLNDITGQIRIIEVVPTTRGIFNEKHYDGRKAIEHLYNLLKKNHLNKVIRGDFTDSDLVAIQNVYDEFHEDNGHYIGHYFRTLYNILKYIDNLDLPRGDKKVYAGLLRAQLSNYELALLTYNCLSSHGNVKMLHYVLEYNILKHVDIEVLADPSHLQLLNEIHEVVSVVSAPTQTPTG